MKMIPVISGVLSILALGTTAAYSNSSLMMVAGNAFSPPAFHEFCRRDRNLCDSHSGAKLMELTAQREHELQAVNSAVNRQIRQREDREISGKDDDWRIPTTEGDCEDFAILKKKELMQRGWSASALLITVARQPFNDEGHTVLTVRTSKGDLILDNLTSRIKNWSSTPYRYFARQSQQETGKWERIG